MESGTRNMRYDTKVSALIKYMFFTDFADLLIISSLWLVEGCPLHSSLLTIVLPSLCHLNNAKTHAYDTVSLH